MELLILRFGVLKKVALFMSGLFFKISVQLNELSRTLKQYGCDHESAEVVFFDEIHIAYVTLHYCRHCHKIFDQTMEVGTAL